MYNMRDQFNAVQKGANSLDSFLPQSNVTDSPLNSQIEDDEPQVKRYRGSSLVSVSMPVFYFRTSDIKNKTNK